MRQLSHLLALCCTFALLLTSFNAEAVTLHAILVCDTTADNIAESVQVDYHILHEELSKIASITGMEYHEVAFTEEQVNATLLDQISELSVGEDDVIFFYFSGHGYRTDSKGTNQWPNLYLTPAKGGIDLLEVVAILRTKHPRLLLAMADSCNNVIPEKFAPPLIKKKREALMVKVPDVKYNYQQLFLHRSGIIIASGCIPGQVSWGTLSGGMYTVSFFHSLHEESHTMYPPDWRILLDRASLNVINMDYDQVPQYEMLTP